MRFAICNEMFENWPIEKVFDTVREVGYEAVEIAPYTLADSVESISPKRRSEIREAAESRGLKIAGLHWLLVKPGKLHINHPDPYIRNRTVDYLRALVELCADLGGRVMVFGSPKQRAVLPGQRYEDAWEAAKGALRRVLPLAAQRGVAICMEPLPEANFIRTMAEARKFVAEVNHPSLRMVADVKSLCSEGEERIPELILTHRDQVAHVHANDANRRGPGFGQTDFRPVFRALREILYVEYVSVEVFDYSPDPVTIARESLAYMKRCLDEVDRAMSIGAGQKESDACRPVRPAE